MRRAALLLVLADGIADTTITAVEGKNGAGS
jgi:hypothetical protein